MVRGWKENREESSSGGAKKYWKPFLPYLVLLRLLPPSRRSCTLVELELELVRLPAPPLPVPRPRRAHIGPRWWRSGRKVKET